MTLRAVLATIRRNWIVAVSVLVVCIAGGAVVTSVLPPRYDTSTQILFQPAAAESSSGTTATSTSASAAVLVTSQMPTYAALTDTATVLDPVAKATGTDSVALQRQVSASVVPDTSIVTISTSASTPEAAAELANQVGASLITQVALLDPTGSGAAAVAGSVVEAPVVPSSSSTFGPIVGGLIGLLVGLVLAYLVILVREALGAPARSRKATPVRVRDEELDGGLTAELQRA